MDQTDSIIGSKRSVDIPHKSRQQFPSSIHSKNPKCQSRSHLFVLHNQPLNPFNVSTSCSCSVCSDDISNDNAIPIDITKPIYDVNPSTTPSFVSNYTLNPKPAVPLQLPCYKGLQPRRLSQHRPTLCRRHFLLALKYRLLL